MEAERGGWRSWYIDHGGRRQIALVDWGIYPVLVEGECRSPTYHGGSSGTGDTRNKPHSPLKYNGRLPPRAPSGFDDERTARP